MHVSKTIIRLACAAFLLTASCLSPRIQGMPGVVSGAVCGSPHEVRAKYALTACLLLHLSAKLHHCSRVQAQQPSAAPGSEEEFLDAIKKGNSARVSELLKQNPDLIKARTKKGTTPVMLAMFSRHKEIAELLATGIETNIFEATALGRIERVRELLKQDPTLVKAFSPEGFTALHGNLNHPDIVQLLIDQGADINVVSHNAFLATPLQSALAMGWTDSARLLIARNANVNCRGEGGGTPLHEAAGNGQIELAKLLLDHGANLNARDDNGKTPLTIALEYKQAEMAKFLRDRKATQ